MPLTACRLTESPRLKELVPHAVGWQVDDLHVLEGDGGLSLRGHAYTALARALAEVEAARLSGLPVVANEVEVG
jgi:hypothetical protein